MIKLDTRQADGQILLTRDPLSPLEGATKQYVDNATGTDITALSGSLQVQIDDKADTSYVDSQDSSLSGTLSSLISTKADTSYVDSQDDALSSSLQSNIDAKADISYVDSQDSSVSGSLNSNITSVSGALQSDINTRALKSYVDSQDSSISGALQSAINTKANTTYVDAQDAALSGSLSASKVSKSGDTMTGNLTLSGADVRFTTSGTSNIGTSALPVGIVNANVLAAPQIGSLDTRTVNLSWNNTTQFVVRSGGFDAATDGVQSLGASSRFNNVVATAHIATDNTVASTHRVSSGQAQIGTTSASDLYFMRGGVRMALKNTSLEPTADAGLDLGASGARFKDGFFSGSVQANSGTFTGNLVVQGDISVLGTTTTLNTEQLLVEDNIVTLNSTFTGSLPTANAGIEVNRGTQTKAELSWDEANDYWRAGLSGSLQKIILQSELNSASGTLQSQISSKANATDVVTITGAQTISGLKTVANDFILSGANSSLKVLRDVALHVDVENLLGTNRPATFQGGTSGGDIGIISTGNQAYSSWLDFVKTRTATGASLSGGLLAEDELIQIYGFGSDGTNYQYGGNISLKMEQNASAGNFKTYLAFGTNNGSSLVDKWKIQSNGNLVPTNHGQTEIGSSTAEIGALYVGYQVASGSAWFDYKGGYYSMILDETDGKLIQPQGIQTTFVKPYSSGNMKIESGVTTTGTIDLQLKSANSKVRVLSSTSGVLATVDSQGLTVSGDILTNSNVTSSGSELNLGALTSHGMNFKVAGSTVASFTNGGLFKYNISSFGITSSTSSGTDNKEIFIGGGGDVSNGRGGFIRMRGNQFASTPGNVQISTGNISNSKLELMAPGSLGTIEISTGSGVRWTVGDTGNLVQSSIGGDIIFNTSIGKVRPASNSTYLQFGDSGLGASLEFAGNTNGGGAKIYSGASGNGNVEIASRNNGGILLQTSGTNTRWGVAQDGTFQFYSNAATIAATTSDNSDNASLCLTAGGGSGSSSRGAQVFMAGNEHSSLSGSIFVDTGASSSGTLALRNFSTNGPITFAAGTGTERARIDASTGSLLINGTTGANSLYKLDVRSRGIFGSGANDAEILIRQTGSLTPAWQLATRSDLGGSNQDLKFMRIVNGSFVNVPLQVSNSDGTVSCNNQLWVNSTGRVSASLQTISFNGFAEQGLGFYESGGQTNGGAFCIFTAVTNGTVGSIARNGANAVIYNTTSDYRLKENIQPLTGCLDKVMQMNPVSYTWSGTQDAATGFLAHEIAAIEPGAVAGEKDAVNEDGSIKPQGLDPRMLVVHTVGAIQELNSKLDQALARIEQLENS